MKSCSAATFLRPVSAFALPTDDCCFIVDRVRNSLFREQNGNRLETGKRILPAEYCFLLEKAVRTFPGNAPLSAEDSAALSALKAKIFTGETGADGLSERGLPAAAEIGE